jgi:hypothetical protein
MSPIFLYDWARQELVYPSFPDGKPIGISTETLRALNFKADDADFRKQLPRYDRPRLV